MLSTKFFSIQVQVLVFCLSYVNGMCPYAHQFNDLSNEIQTSIDAITGSYMTAISYDTYRTECHWYVPQPPKISPEIIEHALEAAVNQTRRYNALDVEARGGAPAPPASSIAMDRINCFFESVTRYIQENTCVSKNTTTQYLSTLQLNNLTTYLTGDVTSATCQDGHITYPDCEEKRLLRQLDGTCNNLERPLDGAVGDCNLHLLPSDYKDGIEQLRTATDGTPLCNPKILSTNLFGGAENRPLSKRLTQFQSMFGEFVIGDNSVTLNHDTGMLFRLQCCDADGHPRIDHPQCAPFFAPPEEGSTELYPNGRCTHFVRSIPCARCKLGPRSPSNAVTATQDLNSVYGVSEEMLRERRTLRDGCLRSQTVNGEELFATERIQNGTRLRCFKKKCVPSPMDVRDSLSPLGLVFALLFHRNHNRHARKIAALNPKWKDEQIFQMARRWNIAEYQHCVYNEYLETLIGDNLMDHFAINPRPLNEFSSYEEEVSPKTILEFQSTAGRQGHTQLAEEITIIEPTTLNESSLNLRDIGFATVFEKIFNEGLVDGVLLGEMYKPAFEATPSIPFKTFVTDTVNFDLGALIIQRQRDHGVPGYVNYLQYFHDATIGSWDDLQNFIDEEDVEKLKGHYKNIEDIELYVGGHYERKIKDAIVGPTFGNIIGIQFHNVKFGDRFFYEHGDQIGSFSIAQLNEIKSKSCFAHILCKNTKLDYVLRDPFRLVSSYNPFVRCSEFTDIDYKL